MANLTFSNINISEDPLDIAAATSSRYDGIQHFKEKELYLFTDLTTGSTFSFFPEQVTIEFIDNFLKEKRKEFNRVSWQIQETSSLKFSANPDALYTGEGGYPFIYDINYKEAFVGELGEVHIDMEQLDELAYSRDYEESIDSENRRALMSSYLAKYAYYGRISNNKSKIYFWVPDQKPYDPTDVLNCITELQLEGYLRRDPKIEFGDGNPELTMESLSEITSALKFSWNNPPKIIKEITGIGETEEESRKHMYPIEAFDITVRDYIGWVLESYIPEKSDAARYCIFLEVLEDKEDYILCSYVYARTITSEGESYHPSTESLVERLVHYEKRQKEISHDVYPKYHINKNIPFLEQFNPLFHMDVLEGRTSSLKFADPYTYTDKSDVNDGEPFKNRSLVFHTEEATDIDMPVDTMWLEPDVNFNAPSNENQLNRLDVNDNTILENERNRKKTLAWQIQNEPKVYKGLFLPYGEEGWDYKVFVDDVELPLEPSLKLISRSPTGFAWGYMGSGPAQLALAILYDYTKDADLSKRYHQQFKKDFVAGWTQEGAWTLTSDDIDNWIGDNIIKKQAWQLQKEQKKLTSWRGVKRRIKEELGYSIDVFGNDAYTWVAVSIPLQIKNASVSVKDVKANEVLLILKQFEPSMERIKDLYSKDFAFSMRGEEY